MYAFQNGAGVASYAMSKAAVKPLGRALRLELVPHGARASVAYFGLIDTDMVHRQPRGTHRWLTVGQRTSSSAACRDECIAARAANAIGWRGAPTNRCARGLSDGGGAASQITSEIPINPPTRGPTMVDADNSNAPKATPSSNIAPRMTSARMGGLEHDSAAPWDAFRRSSRSNRTGPA